MIFMLCQNSADILLPAQWNQVFREESYYLPNRKQKIDITIKVKDFSSPLLSKLLYAALNISTSSQSYNTF